MRYTARLIGLLLVGSLVAGLLWLRGSLLPEYLFLVALAAGILLLGSVYPRFYSRVWAAGPRRRPEPTAEEEGEPAPDRRRR